MPRLELPIVLARPQGTGLDGAAYHLCTALCQPSGSNGCIDARVDEPRGAYNLIMNGTARRSPDLSGKRQGLTSSGIQVCLAGVERGMGSCPQLSGAGLKIIEPVLGKPSTGGECIVPVVCGPVDRIFNRPLDRLDEAVSKPVDEA